jgi:hypothetical protein
VYRHDQISVNTPQSHFSSNSLNTIQSGSTQTTPTHCQLNGGEIKISNFSEVRDFIKNVSVQIVTDVRDCGAELGREGNHSNLY